MNQIAAQERELYLQKCHIELPVIAGFTPVSLPHACWRTVGAWYAALGWCRLTTPGVEGRTSISLRSCHLRLILP